jgi:hypothetical protein
VHIDKYNNSSASNFGHAFTIIQNLIPAVLLDVQKQQEDSDKETEQKGEGNHIEMQKQERKTKGGI